MIETKTMIETGMRIESSKRRSISPGIQEYDWFWQTPGKLTAERCQSSAPQSNGVLWHRFMNLQMLGIVATK
jgi:hypothetical protein